MSRPCDPLDIIGDARFDKIVGNRVSSPAGPTCRSVDSILHHDVRMLVITPDFCDPLSTAPPISTDAEQP